MNPAEPGGANGLHVAADCEHREAFWELSRLLHSYWITQAIAVSAKLGLPELMAGGATRAAELGEATGCHVPSLHRLLRALAALGLCEEHADGSFTLTPMGLLLKGDTPRSLRNRAIWIGRYQWPAWSNLLQSLNTGERARTVVDGSPDRTSFFEELERDPAMAAIFHRSMSDSTRRSADAVVACYDFSSCRRIVDVGGGRGEMLATILRACPAVHGVLFDLPKALAAAEQHLHQAGVADRCELIGGDFFAAVPAGADAYVLKTVIHDWNDAQATAILRSCRAAMPSQAKLLIIEQMMPEQMEQSASHRDVACKDLTMLVMVGGQERTAAEYHRLLSAAGFTMTRLVPTGMDLSVIEAVPGSPGSR